MSLSQSGFTKGGSEPALRSSEVSPLKNQTARIGTYRPGPHRESLFALLTPLDDVLQFMTVQNIRHLIFNLEL
jgi:hypothetical protein